tara:strand:- start:589 stop:720 length:132 start_codon:yes stop_codon:yes gene_type:complete
MSKLLGSIIVLIMISGCVTTDIMPKRKACTGENSTVADILCKK